MAKGVVLVVIDGLTPSVFEQAETPALTFLREHGTYRRAVSTFPSLTPVCASSIATGAHPDVHHIPHLVWFDRDERRLVEYGSSFAALVAAGTRRSLVDTVFNMNAKHLGPSPTVFEALDDAGLRTAAVNFTCYRGRTEHRAKLPGVTRTARGPQRFFFYNVFESDATGAPLSLRNRAGGTIDEYAAAVGRWLVTRDCFDFFLFYLSDYDYASHALGPEGAAEKLADADRAIAGLLDAAGGPEAFLERYDLLLCSDHGQTPVHTAVRLEDAFAGLELFRRSRLERADVAVCASNRAGQVYRLPLCAEPVRALAERLDGAPGVDVTLFLEDGDAVARAAGAELRFGPDGPLRRRPGRARRCELPGRVHARVGGSAQPERRRRARLGRGRVRVHRPRWRQPRGGGSHGSLSAGDSEVPMLAVGIDEPPASITGIAPAVLERLGVSLSRAA